jgi:hypothetical protein
MTYDFYPRIYTDEYYRALGQFVSDFSEIEQTMQIVLWHLSGMKTPVAQAVLSGVRAEDAGNKITRIGVAKHWSNERKAEWKAICDRVSLIRSLRNDILHYGVLWEREGEWVTTNRQFVHTPEKITNSPVTVEILGFATEDLKHLSFHIFAFCFEAKSHAFSALDRTQTDAWQYKQPPQAGRQHKSPGKSPKPKRQPRPSR